MSGASSTLDGNEKDNFSLQGAHKLGGQSCSKESVKKNQYEFCTYKRKFSPGCKEQKTILAKLKLQQQPKENQREGGRMHVFNFGKVDTGRF